MRSQPCVVLAAAAALLGCAGTPAPAPNAAPQSAPLEPHPEEKHFGALRQLTFGGENAEAYWSFDGRQLVYQARAEAGCDQIYTMDPDAAEPTPQLVSTGRGATTCGYFLPGNEDVVYASTHLGGAACPPKPDRSQGYVWPLYPSYDVFRSKADGTGLTRLTHEDGYDAEATVCADDGSIVFTSVRDGDLELYRMDADGGNVKRLTDAPGYDGGAFFNADCSKIVWRASRPTGQALEDYQALLGQGLVRPGKLELFVANADGSDARQITYLGAAAFAPYWHPSGDRILFSSNHADPKGREFDLWAIDTDGTDLEQITHTEGFDGFPMFSPDGTRLAFASNRANAPGSRDTNVFVVDWVESPRVVAEETPADRVQRDAAWLADPAREGRGLGTRGIIAAGEYLEARFREIGLEPVGGSYRQAFDVTTGVRVGEGTRLALDGAALAADAYQPLAFSSEGKVTAPLALAGYGLVDEKLALDDFAGLDVEGRIVVVRRFVPDGEAFADPKEKRRLGDLRQKAWHARERGARALLVVDAPEAPEGASEFRAPPEAPFPGLHRSGFGDAGLPVVIVARAAFSDALARLERGEGVEADLRVALDPDQQPAFNVLGRLPAAGGASGGTLVVGAHYDHLGFGGPNSLTPEQAVPHVGADDNASGTAGILEIARQLAARGGIGLDVVFMAFTAEESGLLGSSHLVKNPPEGFALDDVRAMLNLDMVGRMRDNRLTVLGAKTAEEWTGMIDAACAEARVRCTSSGGGFGASDQAAFYRVGIPVLHFFTGTHGDYHKPSDTIEHLNAAGTGRVATVAASLATALGERGERLTFREVAPELPLGDARSYNASLGSMPDYAGPSERKGVLLAGVRPGGAADLAGMRGGDVLVRLGRYEIGSVHDLMYALNAHKPNETVTGVVSRSGDLVELEVTFQESRRRR